ncbi:hypothetical protein SAMD00019534_087590 [Acytostelium subglobosum LB1]|uniref:hypothetical protein n=1 Tax=Acytostelium subglobosum LB1 TaxID=1410327 RepID=UPI000644C446|nr:hypothetical protein SAMD00019534_087590 [Acytostelium subglobosum LB1]GAM25584.1 hypothetical protein SAMD00019534_087590 [Acytostelium subglobosum LB1]|eukprot:XP_012751570.1 hypothetical protein SAMD00019534_087590 [Acytostelium subglobosum LB1]
MSNCFFPAGTERFLPLVIDTGNEEFLELFLKYLKVNDIAETNNAIKNYCKFKRPGIPINMLRVLRLDYKYLNGLTNIWQAALVHSTKSNMLDSVQYLLDHMPLKEMHPRQYNELMAKCIVRCAKDDNVNIFKALIKSAGDKYILNKNYNDIIDIAADRGHASFIKYLGRYYTDKYGCRVSKASVRKLNYLLLKPNFNWGPLDSVIEWLRTELRVTPKAAIRKNDIAELETITSPRPYSLELDLKIYLQMSQSMALFISQSNGPHTQTYMMRFHGKSLVNMIKAIGKPGSNITAHIACQFIANCNHSIVIGDLPRAMSLAASRSADVMKQLTVKFAAEYEVRYLIKALKKGCRETQKLIIDQFEQRHFETSNIKYAAFNQIAIASLEDVTFILDHLDCVRDDQNILVWAVSNPHLEVFEHVINLFPPLMIYHSMLINIIDRALLCYKPKIIEMIRLRFETPYLASNKTFTLYRPTITTLVSLAHDQTAPSLEYHFKSSIFTNIPVIERLRILNFLLHSGFMHMAPKVIKLCTDHIKALSIDHQQQMFQAIGLKDEVLEVPQASTKLERAFHLVFKDRKTGMHIMDRVGTVHKLLGINTEYLIKGAKLIDNHNLFDYIKYGATEWFLEAYSKFKFSTISGYNNVLLAEAFNRCNTQVVDLLMNNPLMGLDHTMNGLLSIEFVQNTYQHIGV